MVVVTMRQAVVTVMLAEQVAAYPLRADFSALSALSPQRIFTATHSAT